MLERRHFLKTTSSLATLPLLARDPVSENSNPGVNALREALPREFRWYLWHAATRGYATKTQELRRGIVNNYDLPISDRDAMTLLTAAQNGTIGLDSLPVNPETKGPFEPDLDNYAEKYCTGSRE